MLKADHNPIEWPPPDVVEAKDDLDDPEVMAHWVESLKGWMNKNHVDEDSLSESSQ